jgi:(1->4)-alpha-D-glucan 1-alpha-D-glucosylmutase
VSAFTATYRVQCSRDIGIPDLTRLVLYLDGLGVTALYLSPIFAARPGSEHGYDVIDPTRLNPELGSAADFEALAAALESRGMGLVLDIVPNHMLATIENPWWADLLARGRDSQWASYFDIDWTDDGKIVLPVLGTSLREALDAGDLLVESGDDAAKLRYHDDTFPLAAGTDTDDVERALGRQHYTLEYWRDAYPNYRRFFDVNTLVGLHQEVPLVFEATHSLVRDLLGKTPVAALRIDHIDGLRDPAQYLDRLARLVDDTPLMVEKILSGDEQIPEMWPVAGETGYQFLNITNNLFVDPDGLDALRDAYVSVTGRDASFADTVYESKSQVARQLFPGELAGLVRDLAALAPEHDAGALENALVGLAAAFPVYRTYVDASGITEYDHDIVTAAVADARRRGNAGQALDVLKRVLLLDVPDDQRDVALQFVQRWQQFTGPLAAKGLEDTALYRHNLLLSMNEVGADPRGPAPTAIHAFHDYNRQRLATSPRGLNATATHDTKRGEDVRARLNVLSELAGEWTAAHQRWSEMNRPLVREVDGASAPDANVETLLYQTLVGAWPVEEADVPAFRQRLRDYLFKAIRESKERTSWLEPNDVYERAVLDFADSLFDSQHFLDDFLPFQRRVAELAVTNSLAQTLLKVASPGVPDVYQGAELWDLNLVDPDNRRPVDFDHRARLLDGLASAQPDPAFFRDLLDSWQDARIKLYVLSRALVFRRDHAALFAEGDYLPLDTTGAHADRVISFARQHNNGWAVAAVPRLTAGLGFPPLRDLWKDTAVHLPPDAPASWRDALTGGEDVSARDGYLPAAALFAHLPVALLA